MNDTAIMSPSAAPSTMRRSLVPTTYAEAFDFAQHLSKSSMVPAEYRGKPENILLAIQWGMEVGLAPLQAIQNIAVINGKPSVYGDALLAMVKGSPVCEDVIESFQGDGETLTAICEARRRGKAPAVVRFGVADAKKAGLWGKAGPWQQYPRRMLQMRARGFALRDAFPDVLRGVITAEEAADYPVDVSRGREPVDVTPKADLDQFAKAGETIEHDTGEIRPFEPPPWRAGLIAGAHDKTKEGEAAFRSWYRTLTPEQKDALKAEPVTWLELARAADAARAGGLDDEDPFGLPPLKREPAGSLSEMGQP